MYRSVGDDSNTALFTDDYMSQVTQPLHAPLMLDPPKRGAQTITANAVAPASAPAPADDSSGASMTSSPMGDSLVMFGLLGIVAVAGIYFFSRKG